MNEPEIRPGQRDRIPQQKPLGAILIVTLLGLAIVLVWFGMFIISAKHYAPSQQGPNPRRTMNLYGSPSDLPGLRSFWRYPYGEWLPLPGDFPLPLMAPQ